jgi:cysteine desulfurase
MQKLPVYLDYAATTPVDPRVLEAMLPYFAEHFGNAASTTHIYGEIAKKAVDKGRKQVADLINANPEEIIFTSGSTESINMALKGLFWANAGKRRHIITVKTEHKAVLDTCDWLEEIGAEVTYLDVDEEGIINWDQYEQALLEEPLLVCVMYANNETGVIQEIAKIAEMAHKYGALFFTDATQAFGKIPIDIEQEAIDMLCFSAHKIYGPKGVGGLYVKKGVKLIPLIHGGGHQGGLRSGTLNVPGIVGLGKAASISIDEMDANYNKIKVLRDSFEQKLLQMGRIKINGKVDQRLPNISNIELINEDAENFLVKNKREIALSAGSACNSEVISISHVLNAMGLMKHNSIRLSFNCFLINADEIIKKIV